MRQLGGVLGALAKMPLDFVRGENAGRNARDGYATEHLEIASYELLSRIAQKAGDEETATAAREIIEEERAMAKMIEQHWDRFAELSLQEEGIIVANDDFGQVRGTASGPPSGLLVEPGREEALDVPAASWPLEAGRDGLVLDDDEGRHRLDLEPLEQVRMLLFRDHHDVERAVVAPPLQHLGEEPFHAPAVTRQARMEEDEPGLVRERGDSHCHVAPPLNLEGRGLGPCAC